MDQVARFESQCQQRMTMRVELRAHSLRDRRVVSKQLLYDWLGRHAQLDVNEERRGERLQRELDGDATLKPAERIGRSGWLMWAVGLVMIVAAVLMSFPASSLALSGIMIAWWFGRRGGREPGWRAIVLGGVAAIALLGIPIGLSYANPLDLPPQTVSEMLLLLGLYLLPMVLLVVGAGLLIEGFRAAAT